jgi:hypothetical protein
VVHTGAALTAVVLAAVAVPIPAAVGTFSMVAVAHSAAILTPVAISTPVAVDLDSAVALDSTLAAVLTGVAARTFSAAIFGAEYPLVPHRGAAARLGQPPLWIIGQVLLHQMPSEPTALLTATANGTRLEAAAILLSR